jgi:hypothetical protein
MSNLALRALGLGLLLVAALGDGTRAQGSNTFDGQYMGQLTLTKIISGDCTRPPPGALFPLRIANGQVQFKYTPRFDTMLQGTIDGNGIFKASQRLPRGSVIMTGRIRGNNVTAYIISPSCKYTFSTQY